MSSDDSAPPDKPPQPTPAASKGPSANPDEFRSAEAGSDAVPPVDEQLLLALVRNEIPESQARDVHRLIHTHSDWTAAHTRIVSEEARRLQQAGGDDPSGAFGDNPSGDNPS